MYIGRFLVVSPELAAYRVSSRSFPNRKIIERDDALAVVPTEKAEPTTNPYVSYHCLRTAADTVTIGNGSHVDPIAEKIDLGYPARDALATGLLALDYEKDDYNTPRIAAILADSTYVGIVRRDALIVESITEPTLVATYEHDKPTETEAPWEDVRAAARGSFELEYEHPVCSAAVSRRPGSIETAIYNGPGADL